MATKKQLKEYARALEALLFISTRESNDQASIINIVSDNVDLPAKIQVVKSLARLNIATENNIQLLSIYRKSMGETFHNLI